MSSNHKNATKRKRAYDDTPLCAAQFETLGYDRCVDFLKKCDSAYHNGTQPLISDAQYDTLRSVFNTLYPDRPYTNIGAAPSPKALKVKLPYPMASLDKALSESELMQFLNRFQDDDVFQITDKLDGLSGGIYYCMNEKREPVLTTRYNGVYGRVKTHLLPSMRGCTTTSTCKEFDFVRGEMLIHKNVWARMMAKDPSLKSARTTLAGMVNRDHIDGSQNASITFVAYECVMRGQEPKSGVQQLLALSNAGFEVAWFTTMTKREITHQRLVELHNQRVKDCDYTIDGIVLRHCKSDEQEIPSLSTVHDDDDETLNVVDDDEDEDDGLDDMRLQNPKGAIAFKVQPDAVASEVIRVTWKLSKHNLLKPRVWFRPVVLSGSVVEKATGFNAKFIHDHKVGPGSTVHVLLSGHVIPYIQSVTPSTSGSPQLPDDELHYRWNESKVDFELIGTSTDGTQRKIAAFFETMEVDHMGPGNVALLCKHFNYSLHRILTATKVELSQIERYQAKSVDNIFNSLQTLHNKPLNLARLMAASSIFGHGFGVRRCNLIVSNIPDFLTWNCGNSDSDDKIAQLMQIEGIGELTARNFYDAIPRFQTFLKEHPTLIVASSAKSSVVPTSVNLTICFTGCTMKQWTERLAQLGIQVSDSFTKHVNLVIVKDLASTSSTAKKAREKNIPIMSVADFAQKYHL